MTFLNPDATDTEMRAEEAYERDAETRLMLARRHRGPHQMVLTSDGRHVWVSCPRCGLGSDALATASEAQDMYVSWHGGAR